MFKTKKPFPVLAKVFSRFDGFELLSDYCELREIGLRKQALEKEKAFIESTENLSIERKREIARVICQEAGPFGSYNLKENFVIPILEKWCEEEPQNPQPYKWMGLYYWKDSRIELLEKALLVDPQDDEIKITLAECYLYGLDYDTHHLHEGLYIGDPDEDMEESNHIAELILTIQHMDTRSKLLEELKTYKQMIEDFMDYKSSKSGIPFPKWCADKGRKYKWSKAFYYDP